MDILEIKVIHYDFCLFKQRGFKNVFSKSAFEDLSCQSFQNSVVVVISAHDAVIQW